jgi:hypothetical protein
MGVSWKDKTFVENRCNKEMAYAFTISFQVDVRTGRKPVRKRGGPM